MEYFESLLVSIDFSVWQIIVLIIVFAFYKDIKLLFSRVVGIETNNTKVTFTQTKSVTELQRLLSDISEKNSEEEPVKVVSHALEKKLIGSLIIIKQESSVLWSALVDKNSVKTIDVSTTKMEFDKIVDSLESLKAEKLFNYSVLDNRWQTITSRKSEIDISIKDISSRLTRLVREAAVY